MVQCRILLLTLIILRENLLFLFVQCLLLFFFLALRFLPLIDSSFSVLRAGTMSVSSFYAFIIKNHFIFSNVCNWFFVAKIWKCFKNLNLLIKYTNSKKKQNNFTVYTHSIIYVFDLNEKLNEGRKDFFSFFLLSNFRFSVPLRSFV